MKRGFIFATLLFGMLSILCSQPIKTVPIGFAFQTYMPDKVESVFVPVPGPRGPRGFEGKVVIQHDSVVFVPDMSQYIKYSDINYLERDIYNKFADTQREMDIIRYNMYQLDSVFTLSVVGLTEQQSISELQWKGTTKIISGIGLQAIAAALVMYSGIDDVRTCQKTQTINIPYTYTTYELGFEPAQTGRCDPHSHPYLKPILIPKEQSGMATTQVTDHYSCITHKNRTPYYVSAGILASAGVALEVLGIIDLHNAHIIAGTRSIGVVKTF